MSFLPEPRKREALDGDITGKLSTCTSLHFKSMFAIYSRMQGSTNETVGKTFKVDLLQAARDKTLAVIEATAARIRAGINEAEAKLILAEVQTNFGAERTWHPPQVRFGKNTLLPFGVPGDKEVYLHENDIFFIDIGPVFANHEGDVGRAFSVGDNQEHRRCAQSARDIWIEVRQCWKETGATGPELYHFATESAKARGWQLSLQKANGHRIADFPHAARHRGSVEGWMQTPSANRWILEIQIRHPEKPFGAFYEDLLN